MDALKILMLYILSSLLFACDHPEKIKGHRSLSNVDAAVAHKERPVEDVQRDKIRSPQKVLAFFDIQQGDEVVELLASNGYYTELLSRCVGRSGKVYMHNNERYFEFQTDKNVKERLANNRLSNVVRWDQELSNLKFKESSIDKVLMISIGWRKMSTESLSRYLIR
jgi:predicted methyltransferase